MFGEIFLPYIILNRICHTKSEIFKLLCLNCFLSCQKLVLDLNLFYIYHISFMVFFMVFNIMETNFLDLRKIMCEIFWKKWWICSLHHLSAFFFSVYYFLLLTLLSLKLKFPVLFLSVYLSSTFIYGPILIKTYMNSNIIKTQFLLYNEVWQQMYFMRVIISNNKFC